MPTDVDTTEVEDTNEAQNPQKTDVSKEPSDKTPKPIPAKRFNQVIGERNELREQLNAANSRLAEYETLEEEKIGLELNVASLTEKIESQTVDRLKMDLAYKAGVFELWDRLKGSTQEEIEADIATLSSKVNTKRQIPIEGHKQGDKTGTKQKPAVDAKLTGMNIDPKYVVHSD